MTNNGMNITAKLGKNRKLGEKEITSTCAYLKLTQSDEHERKTKSLPETNGKTSRKEALFH